MYKYVRETNDCNRTFEIRRIRTSFKSPFRFCFTKVPPTSAGLRSNAEYVISIRFQVIDVCAVRFIDVYISPRRIHSLLHHSDAIMDNDTIFILWRGPFNRYCSIAFNKKRQITWVGWFYIRKFETNYVINRNNP